MNDKEPPPEPDAPSHPMMTIEEVIDNALYRTIQSAFIQPLSDEDYLRMMQAARHFIVRHLEACIRDGRLDRQIARLMNLRLDTHWKVWTVSSEGLDYHDTRPGGPAVRRRKYLPDQTSFLGEDE